MDSADPLAFGTLLRRYRRAAGLTQEAVAESASVSARTISDLERGVNRAPHRDTVALLADALALPLTERQAFVRTAERLGWSVASVPAEPDHPLGLGVPFVGRRRELALLERHLAEPGPPVLLLAGEPGIGKSRLLQEAIPQAVAQGWRVLADGCQRRGGQEPYAPLLGAMDRYIQAQPPVQLRADLRDCAWLVRLLPELATGPIEPLPAWTLAPEQERRLMFKAVTRFLTNVAGPAGTLLVLDDLQWAGPDALDLLRVLVQSAVGIPLRLIGAYRDTEVRPREALSALLADLATAGLAAQRTLAPLERTETAQLLDLLLEGVEGVGRALRDQAVERSGGVPFFAVSCAQGLRSSEQEGGDENASGSPAPAALPWSAAQSIRQRMAALSESAQAVLDTAAVIGRVTSLQLLLAAVAQPEVEALNGLEAACRGRLLEEADASAYQFAHDVIREVVEADLGVARRIVLHRRVATALEKDTLGEPPLERLAYHYKQSDLPAKAALYLERAGDRASGQGGLAMAASYYQDAVQCLDTLGHGADAARVREKWGGTLRARALYGEALTALEGAAQTYTVCGDRESLGRVTAQIGQVLGDRGTPEEGVARVQPLVQQLEESGPSPALALLHTTLAWLFLNTGQYPEQLVAAERAVALAGAVGEERVRAQAELWRAEALDSLRGRHASLAAFETAAALAETSGDLHTLSYALPLIAMGYLERDALKASRQAEQAVAVAERYGNPVQLAVALHVLGEWAAATGDWGRARASVERALALDRQAGGSYATAYCLGSIGRLCLMEGRWTEAAQYLDESVTAATRTGNLHALRGAQRTLAECDLLLGRPEAARDRLLPLLDRPGLVEPAVPELLVTLAWALLDLGDVEGADSLADKAISRAPQENVRAHMADALRVQAQVRMRQERWPEAQQMLEEGLALARQQPSYPYTEARLLRVYGTLHLRTGGRALARERLQEALAIFRRLGARKDAEDVEQAIAAVPPVSTVRSRDGRCRKRRRRRPTPR